MKIHNLILGTFFLLTIAGNIDAASFDCGKATSEIEKIICSNDELSRLDESLNKAYLEALKRPDIKEQMIKSQRQWLKNERSVCRNAECLKKTYETRIKELGLSSYGIVILTPPKGSTASSNGTQKVSKSQAIEPPAGPVQTKTEQQHESTTAPSSKCFECLAHKELPFEIYADSLEGCKKYIQPLQKEYGLSTNGIPFIECANEVDAAPLCNGNFVAVWAFSLEKFPVPLTGRIFDSEFKTVHDDFPISDSSGGLEEWEHSLSTLYDGGFVVTWKTWKTSPRARKEIKLRGRIFDDAGKPKGKSFDIYSKGSNNGGFVYGMPTGGFLVVWNNSNRNSGEGSALLRIYDGMGRPTTKEIIIDADQDQCFVKPRAYITSDGNINVFMTCQSSGFDRNYFFRSARSYTETGNPLTDVLTGSDMNSLEGYTSIREQHIKEKAMRCEWSLREFKKRFKERRYCKGRPLSPSIAYDMKTSTNDQRMKRFFANYCAEYKNLCIVPDFEEKYINKCLQE